MKGVFIRKDNGKQLTTTRVVQGDELIQVKYKDSASVALLICISKYGDHEFYRL